MTAAELKQQVSIVDVIGSRINLETKGSRHWAQCPFHDEKTASFSVDPNRQRWHCFGCGESGDVIDFLCRIDGIDFKTACSQLDPSFAASRTTPRLVTVPEWERLWNRVNRWQVVYFGLISEHNRTVILGWAIDNYHPCMHPMTLKLWQYRRWLKRVRENPEEKKRYAKALAAWKKRRALYARYRNIQSEDDVVRFWLDYHTRPGGGWTMQHRPPQKIEER